MSLLIFLAIVGLALASGYAISQIIYLKQENIELKNAITQIIKQYRFLQKQFESVSKKKSLSYESKQTKQADDLKETASKKTTGEANEKHGEQPEPIHLAEDREAPSFTTLPPRSQTEWELLIGGKWLNRIGAVALVIGLAFFIKYAFDNNWVNEVVRVTGGGVIGLLLLWSGARSHRKDLAIFGQGLTGAGIAILYVSIFASFNFYQLVSLPVAFTLMTAVTILAFWQAIHYNALAISLLGWLGGFLTPFLLRSDEGSTTGLFTYLAILTMGMLQVVWKKKNWSILYYLTMVAVYVITFSWMLFHSGPSEYALRMFFLTLFWLLFFINELFFTLRLNHWLKVNTGAAGFNGLCYFMGMYFLVNSRYEEWTGGITLLIGFFYLAPILVWKITGKLEKIDRLSKWRYGFTFLMFLTIANAIQWERYEIVYAWTIEAFLLTWWSVRKKVALGYQFSYILYALSSFLLLTFTEEQPPSLTDWQPIFNEGALAYLGLAAAMAISAFLMQKLEGTYIDFLYQSLHVSWSVLLFIFSSAEISLYFDKQFLTATPQIRESLSYHRYLFLFMVWLSYSLYIAWVGYRKQLIALNIVSWAMLVLGTIFTSFWSIDFGPIDQFVPIYNWRCVSLIGATWIIYLHHRWLKNKQGFVPTKTISLIFTCTMVVLLFELISVEINDFFHPISLDQSDFKLLERMENQKQMVLSLAWLLYSFILLGVGLRRKQQLLRIIAIALFGLTIAKIFLFDLSFLGTLYRIFSFIGLGVILLIVSYFYQRYKHWFQTSVHKQ